MTTDTGTSIPPPGSPERSAATRAALGVGLPTGAYGISFGAISVAAGLSVWQTCVLSLLLFSGGSQFAMVGILGAGGGNIAAAGSGLLLGSRNVFYGVRLASLLRLRGWRRLAGAQLVIDETTAVATAQPSEPAARLGFWVTGATIYVLWNVATLLGALFAGLVSDPNVLGFDVAAPAAFLALLSPRMRGREPWMVGLAAAVVALGAATILPAGVPVLIAAAVAIAIGLARAGSTPADA